MTLLLIEVTSFQPRSDRKNSPSASGSRPALGRPEHESEKIVLEAELLLDTRRISGLAAGCCWMLLPAGGHPTFVCALSLSLFLFCFVIVVKYSNIITI